MNEKKLKEIAETELSNAHKKYITLQDDMYEALELLKESNKALTAFPLGLSIRIEKLRTYLYSNFSAEWRTSLEAKEKLKKLGDGLRVFAQFGKYLSKEIADDVVILSDSANNLGIKAGDVRKAVSTMDDVGINIFFKLSEKELDLLDRRHKKRPDDDGIGIFLDLEEVKEGKLIPPEKPPLDKVKEDRE